MKLDQVEQLGYEFHKRVRRQLGADDLIDIDERNWDDGPEICATHDFCDPNVLMMKSIAQCFNVTEDQATDLLCHSEEHKSIVDAAWEAASDNGFAKPWHQEVR